MSYEPLNRRLALLSAIFAFLGVLLGAIALGTNYWTIKPTVEPIYNGTTRLAEGESVRRWNVSILLRKFLKMLSSKSSRVFSGFVKITTPAIIYFVQLHSLLVSWVSYSSWWAVFLPLWACPEQQIVAL